MSDRRTEAPAVFPRAQRPLSRGFSLIELLIVVAIILIIAAIALPNLMRSRISANEAAAVSNLRTITTANVIYSTQWGIGYAALLADLSGTGAISANSAQLIDPILASSAKNGYTYTYVPAPPSPGGTIDAYAINADPLTPGTTGQRYFFMNETGVIRQNATAVATTADQPIS